MNRHRIAVLAGDGIGKEVIPAGIDVLKAAASRGDFALEFTAFPWGCDFYLKNGRMMDADAVEQLMKFDAIYLGAIGDPKVPDHISAGELLLPLRRRLVQYVNLRPVRLLPGITSPLAGRTAHDIDIVCVRENSEGEYCGVGGRVHVGTPDELAEQTGIFTRRGIERIARYAFTLAASRPRRLLASATKSNALVHSMMLWDEVVAGVAKDFPQVVCRVTPAFGVNEKLAEVIALRAGIDIAHPLAAREACRCWEPNGEIDACGPGCAARTADNLTSTR